MYFFLLLLNLDAVSGEAFLVNPAPRLGTTRTRPQKYYYGIHGEGGIRYPFSDAFLNTCGTGRGTNPGGVSATYKTGDKPLVQWKMLTGLGGEPERIRVAIMYSDDDNFNDNVIYDVSNNDVSGSLCSNIPGTDVENGECGGTTVGFRTPKDFEEKFKALTKPCTQCVLQWVWDTRDGYGFVDCADITITGEAITDTNTGGPPVVTTSTNPECKDFCNKMQDTCRGEYESLFACNRQCQSQARSILTESITGDTFECRRSHVEKAKESGNKAVECSSAGPSGDNMCLAASACDIFCNVFNEVCKDDVLGTVAFEGFRGIEKCVETCSSLNQTGVVGAMSGNTLQCREFQLALASDTQDVLKKELLCDNAQPVPTAVCISSYKPCDTFCSSWDKWCGDFVNITQYINCTIECENIISIGNLGDRSGNTLQCREYYLGAAALTQQPGSVSAKIACESAAKDGGEFCRGSPPGSTSNAVKLRIAGGLGTFVVLLVGLF